MSDDVEWDPRKAAANLKKHGLDFADAATVLHDDQPLRFEKMTRAKNDTSRSVWTRWETCWFSSIRGEATGRA